MATEADAREANEQWEFSIYLVGFPNAADYPDIDDQNVPVADMIRRLVPEARIVAPHSFRDSADGEQTVEKQEGQTSVASSATRQSSHIWIEEEALALLITIQENAPIVNAAKRSKVLLAGYGFGGIVVKQAVIIANTTPNYYGVALNISSLVFMATPHRPDAQLAWEEVLLDAIRATKTNDHGRQSSISSDFVNRVSEISHVFFRFAAKYSITNFIEGKGFRDHGPIVGELGTFNNNLEEVVLWSDRDINSLMFCPVDDLDKLESIRSHFAPVHLLKQDASGYSNPVLSAAVNDSYFEALQSLSTSRWILCESRNLDKPGNLSEFKEIWHSLLNGIVWKDVCAGSSIQVTGPAGHGKSALVKLISQEIRQRSPVVVIDYFPLSLQRGPPTLCGVYISFVHQAISQRPSLFLPVENLMTEILRQKIWTERSLWNLLTAMLRQSQSVSFLIIVYDFEDWPSEIRSWWCGTLSLFLKSCGLSFAFVTSSRLPISDFSFLRRYEFDLKIEYEQYKNDFIKSKTNSVLQHAYGSVTFERGLSNDVREKIISRAKTFQGSFTAIDRYLALLTRAFALTTSNAIVRAIESSPQTEDQLYKLEIEALQTKPPDIFFLASSAISWMLWSVRPLRIEELGAAVAINRDISSMTEFRSMVSMDIEHDLRSHLGPFLAIENRYARITSALARKKLSSDNTREVLGLQNDSELAMLCLHYLSSILKDKQSGTWEKCLSQVSWKHRMPIPGDPALEFVDYACRFWPTHFHSVKEPDGRLKDTVIQFLLAPGVGLRWFELYLLCMSETTNPLVAFGPAHEPTVAVPEPNSSMPGEVSLDMDEATINSPDDVADAQRLAAQICSYVGLHSIISEILGVSASTRELKTVNINRGYLVRTVASIDARSTQYLDCAIYNDDDGVVKELLDFDAVRVTKYFPLHKAAQAGSINTAKTLFNLLANPAQTDPDGRTPLHLAAIGGSTKIMRLLLGTEVCDGCPKRTDVPRMIDIKDGNAQTPLVIAARMGNTEAAKLLIGSGANLAIRDIYGNTALHYTIMNCPEVVGDYEAKDITCTLDNDHCNSLHAAANFGSVQTTSDLVSASHISGYLEMAINAEDHQGKTPLHYAAENGFTDVVKIFLKYELGAGLTKRNYQQAGELAAARGHLATVKLFISPTMNLSGDRFLEAACRAGQLLVVLYLLRNELASPDGDGSLGPRPILLAATKGHDEIVRSLLRYHAAADIEDADGKTPLHHAAETGREHVALTLLQHQADVNAPDLNRKTPLHSAAEAGKARIVQLLVKRKADIEACSRRKETALHLAVRNPRSVKALLDASADDAVTNILGRTPLHMAVLGRYYESVDLLICDAGIDARDEDGRPPLYFAIMNNDPEMVKALCKGRHNLRDSQDRMDDALRWSVEFSALDVLHLLLDISSESINKPDDSGRRLIHKAAERDSLAVVALLLESGAAVNVSDESKSTPLHDAANKKYVHIVRKLIESGAKVNEVDEHERTPLHLAAKSNSIEILAVLVDANATINVRDSEQRTPLHLATFLGYGHVVESLLKEDADIQTVDYVGRSPLHTAALYSYRALVKLFLDNGASPDQVDSSGDTALHLAIKNFDASIVQLMLDRGADFKINRRDGLSCLGLASGYGLGRILEMLLGIGSSSISGRDWDFEDVVAAYWQAITKHQLETFKILVKKERRLLGEVSNEGFPSLETCLRNRGQDRQEEPIAVSLLEFGADPFQGRQEDLKSGFELGIISRRSLKQRFVNACLERVSKNPSPTTSGLGFKELRIATELDTPDLWEKLKPLRDATSGNIDQDGWSLDHFIYQSANRIPMQLRGVMSLKPTRTPTGLVLPPTWLPLNTDIEALGKIAPSRLQASFRTERNRTASSLRGDFPFPARGGGTAYFEIAILHTEHIVDEALYHKVTVGFCGEFCDLTQSGLGRNMWSVGYGGLDGGIFEVGYPRRYTGRTFGPGNTVGCGIDYDRKEYFFTLGEKVVARHSSDVIDRKLYPAISHSGGACDVKVNFGQDEFVWPGARK